MYLEQKIDGLAAMIGRLEREIAQLRKELRGSPPSGRRILFKARVVDPDLDMEAEEALRKLIDYLYQL